MSPLRIGGLAVGCVLGATAALAQSEIGEHQIHKAQHFSAKGSRALRAGNFGAALPMFQKALQAVPAFPDAHMGLGHVALKEQSYEQALRAYRDAEEGYTRLADALFRRRSEAYDEAQEQIRNLQQELGELRARQNRVGSTQEAPGLEMLRIEQAIAHLELIKRPEQGETVIVPAEVPFFIGNALMHLGRLEEAIDAWRATVRRDPGFAPVYNNLAVALWKSGRVAEARACIARAEALGIVPNPAFKADLARAEPGAGLSAASCP